MKNVPRVLGRRLNSPAAADYLGITQRTLRWLRDTRKVEYHKLGRECVYDIADLDRLWEKSRVAAANGFRPAWGNCNNEKRG